ncbi:hypothetical protein C5612_16860 [Pseudomonas frederiksbergensis]|uniref:Uncharacterized protein n=1 Tax=Pseudomonas frederiksbergensis TaxID=104087 RepID=A0A2S8HJZ5_9PSED|nr:hypothetical protein C5612_16860 [Pseudomonas frederiksbergensis]
MKSFYADARVWSNQDGKPLFWIDDISLSVNGLEIVEDSFIQSLRDNDEVQILNGVIYSYEDLGEVATLAEYFKSWQDTHDAPPGSKIDKHQANPGPSLKRCVP